MRVAVLADLAADGVPVGGVQRAVTTLTTALQDAGLEVTVIAPDFGIAEVTHSHTYPFPLTRLPLPGKGQILRRFKPWVATCHAALAEFQPQIVHAHGLLHNGVAAAQWPECPTLLTAHGDPVADAREHYAAAVFRAMRPMLNRAVIASLAGADLVANVTCEWWVNLPRKPRGMVHVPNAIEPVFFGGRRPEPQPRVMYFGGTRRIKGLDLLLEAWESVHRYRPDVTLDLFGVDEAEAEAVAGTRASQLPEWGCRAHGPVPTNRVAEEMAAGGVVAVPSRFEVAPLVVPEAWASQVPLVATAVGGVPAMAASAAYLCGPEAASIADALLAALEGGPIAGARIAIGAERACAHRPEAVAAAHLTLYSGLLDGEASGPAASGV